MPAVRLPFRRSPWVGVPLLVAAAAAMLVVAGCATVGMGKAKVTVTVTAAPTANSCGRPTGYPLTFRVLQVTDGSVLSGVTLTQVWDKESALLKAALVDKQESFVDPGGRRELELERKPNATAVIVVANYCRSNGTCWYHVQPLSQGGSVKLLAGADCLSAK